MSLLSLFNGLVVASLWTDNRRYHTFNSIAPSQVKQQVSIRLPYLYTIITFCPALSVRSVVRHSVCRLPPFNAQHKCCNIVAKPDTRLAARASGSRGSKHDTGGLVVQIVAREQWQQQQQHSRWQWRRTAPSERQAHKLCLCAHERSAVAKTSCARRARRGRSGINIAQQLVLIEVQFRGGNNINDTYVAASSHYMIDTP